MSSNFVQEFEGEPDIYISPTKEHNINEIDNELFTICDDESDVDCDISNMQNELMDIINKTFMKIDSDDENDNKYLLNLLNKKPSIYKINKNRILKNNEKNIIKKPKKTNINKVQLSLLERILSLISLTKNVHIKLLEYQLKTQENNRNLYEKYINLKKEVNCLQNQYSLNSKIIDDLDEDIVILHLLN